MSGHDEMTTQEAVDIAFKLMMKEFDYLVDDAKYLDDPAAIDKVIAEAEKIKTAMNKLINVI